MEDKQKNIIYHSPIIFPSGISYRKNKDSNSIIIDFIGYVNDNEININSSIVMTSQMIDNLISDLEKIKKENTY